MRIRYELRQIVGIVPTSRTAVFVIWSREMESLEGHFLIAKPNLSDSNFFRSVVLMIHHDEEGAFGLVLNRPIDRSIGELWELISETPCFDDSPVYLGGPVQPLGFRRGGDEEKSVVEGSLMAIHTDPILSEREVVDGIHVAIDMDLLEQLVSSCDGPLRVFSGYAGWHEGQLEDELAAGGWLTLPADEELIFADDESLWKLVTERIGLGVLEGMIDLVTVPDDPSLN